MAFSHALSVQLSKWKEELLDEKVVDKSISNNPGFLLPVLDQIKESDCIQKVTIGLSRLVWMFPVAARFAEQYFSKHGSPLCTVGNRMQALQVSEPATKRRRVAKAKANVNPQSDVEESHLLTVLKAVLVIMRKLPRSTFAHWVIDDFLSLGNLSSKQIRWLSAQCLARLLELSDSETSDLVKKFGLLEEDSAKQAVIFEELINSLSSVNIPLSTSVGEYFPGNEINQVSPHMDLLSVGGVLVKSMKPLDPSERQPFESLNVVPIPSVLNHVKKILLQIQHGTPVCLSGPIGVGKTSLLCFTASICGRNSYPDVITVQMSDQIDSRLLLGSYHSTDLPGQFVWKPGCLTRAILNGHWIIFEDMDSAPSDVVTLLDAINGTKQVSVPGYGQINQFHRDFRMFCTIRTSGSGNTRNSPEKFCKSWTNINVEGLSATELTVITKELFHSLSPIVDRLVEIFNSMRNPTISIKRSISVRDLIKFCQRLPKDLDFSTTSSAIAIFHEACDVFISPLQNFQDKLVLAEVIGTHLNLLKSKVEYFLSMSKPNVNICGNTSTIVVGRFDLPIFKQLSVSKKERIGVYSLTKRTCCLLEMIAGTVKNKEPVLLVGETGVGKTSCIQYLANVMQQKMIVVNLNRQSDSSDLLGGYKPVELKYIFAPLREEFEALFFLSFNKDVNSKFINHIMTCFANQRWSDLLKLMSHVQKAAVSKKSTDKTVLDRWKALGNQISRIDSQLNNESESPFAFSFIEGTLITAIKNGYWILLDEVNLATSEMLQCLSGILDKSSQIHLWEKGDEEPVERHPDFHLFAAMNPSTDVGKKDLPIGIRNRFSEFYVDELIDEDELRILTSDYLADLSLPNEQISNIVEFYLKVKQLSATSLIDGMGKRPHFSLRTFCRALKISSFNLYGSVRRSLYESFCLSFLTQLDYSSHPIVQNLVAKYICGKTEIKALLSQPLPCPSNQNVILVEGYWLPRGKKEPFSSNKYILTPSVRRNLKDIARVVSAGKLPILIQGETSVGKTSLIQFLADATGNACYRINNHQHTDLQEYVGSYQSDDTGKLVFTEGVLVQAMRRGEWIILDELNLAPSEVLEALNRLLDDNRQLFITETGITITAHPNFMLFATQNPPGLYGGRKLLSRAFRNRFVELHFDEIPKNELETILHQRCDIPVSYCKKIINVLTELQTRRKSSAALQGKHSFATLRDLFRWAERYRQSGKQKTTFYDWDQHLADEGYLVLAGKSRKLAEVEVIREVLQKYLKRIVDPNNLFSLHEKTSEVTKDLLTQVLNSDVAQFKHIVWTYPMRRLAVLIGSSMKFKEPILLVGETGAGKTTVVQLLSHIYDRKLYSVNCHMHSESSDFLGGLRPVRNHEEKEDKLFEWVDGPLVEAMESGGIFLADEISLADDSVLERLNSVLESERSLLVAEKGDETPKLIIADDKFQFMGTMNPGGDYGKKELSPALRNRLTEIWCESVTDDEDLQRIIEHNLSPLLKNKGVGLVMVNFVHWLKNNELGQRCIVSIRDYLAWVNFVNHATSEDRNENKLNLQTALEHGACLSFLDGLGVGNTATENVNTTRSLRDSGLAYLRSMMTLHMGEHISQITSTLFEVSGTKMQLGPFVLERHPKVNYAAADQSCFAIESPTTSLNALRIFRALQLNKPILLEGSPGQGKTALVTAMAKVAGFPLTRINLSEQTDISDLFGADLPVEGQEGGHFAWRDGPLIQALKNQSWILLDELNLASQSVLEGLNACLDHRGEIYVPELNKTFTIYDNTDNCNSTRIFACQNPIRQGGARKGLPKSFLNRFTQVFMDPLVMDDMKFIIQNYWPALSSVSVDLMTTFANVLHEIVCVKRQFAQRGGPWDFNLRDLMRWAEVTVADYDKINLNNKQLHPELFVDLIYGLRMRSNEDRRHVLELFYKTWSAKALEVASPLMSVLPWGQDDIQLQDDVLRCGRALLQRSNINAHVDSGDDKLIILQQHLPSLEAIMTCLSMGWMPILVGGTSVGKTCLVKLLAKICGKRLDLLTPSPEMDTIELLGGFEQADIYRKIDETCVDVCDLLLRFVKDAVLLSADWVEDGEPHHRLQFADVVGKSDSTSPFRGLDWQLLDLWKNIKGLPHLTPDGTSGHAEEIKRIQNRVDFLQKAYLRCKSFFETQYCSDLGHEVEEASSYEYEGTTRREDVYNKRNGKLKEKVVGEEKKENYSKAGAAKQHLERVARELEQIYTHLKAGVQTGSFQWIDSILIKALVAGNWLLIDGANRCSAAVLDRLNSLMEPNGSLLLSERGSLDGKIVEIKPHSNFRLILAMDPAYGEISRAMRNRGVEIFMSNSPSTLWDQVHEHQSSVMDMDITEDNCSSGSNDDAVNEITSWTSGDVCPTLQSEFGITVFDLDALLRTEGLCNPKLRAAVVNLHREIHQAVASSPGGGIGIEKRFPKLISTVRQMVLQMQNGVSYKESMWNAVTSSFMEDDCWRMEADKKVEIQEIITQFCQGLDDNTFAKLEGKSVSITTVSDFGNSQIHRIWKNLDVISNALSETSWSQYESWRTKENRKLVEDFLILTLFARVMKKDAHVLQLALSNYYPLKSALITKLATVLETDSSHETFMSLQNQGDIQGVAHLMAKFMDGSKGEQAKFLNAQLKMSLKLHTEKDIFVYKSLQNPRKGTLGFVSQSIRKTDSGNLFEFLYGFWKIVTSYNKLLHSCLSTPFDLNNADDILTSGESVVAQYSRTWLNGMKAVLWRKWMRELAQEEFDCKRPSEKLKSNIALVVQWIGEQVVPTLHAINGIDNSLYGKELEALVQKCLQPLDHCGNRMLLQRSTSFRSFYGIRPFLPSDSLNMVNTTLSLCLKVWTANSPVDLHRTQMLLESCSNGNGAMSSHRSLSQICEKLLKLNVLTPVSLSEVEFVENMMGNLEEISKARITDSIVSDHVVGNATKIATGINEFLQLLNISTSNGNYSVFMNPLRQALSCSNKYEFLHSVFHWQDMERFRQSFTDCPPAVMLKSSCLLPYFASKLMLDDETHMLRSASLGHRETAVRHFKKLNSQLSHELLRERMAWESTSGLIESTCTAFMELTKKWAHVFREDECMSQKLESWIEKLEDILRARNEFSSGYMAELGCVIIELSCFMLEIATYLPVVDPSVESEVLTMYLNDEIEYFSSWLTAQRLLNLYTTGYDPCSTIVEGVSRFGHVHPYLNEVSQSLQKAGERLKIAKSGIAARPNPPEYEAMRHEALQFVRTMASKNKIADLTQRVRSLFLNGSTPSESDMSNVLVACSSWLESCSSFVYKQLRRFWYWDINLSYIHPAVEVVNGFMLICDAIRRLQAMNASEKSKTLELLRFPNNHIPAVADASGVYEEPWAYKRATKKLLVSAWWNFCNRVISHNCITPRLLSDLHEFTKEVARIWKEQQEEKERQKEMENAFYIYKGKEKKLASSEEEQEMESIASIFPDFAGDFQDLIESNSLESSPMPAIGSTASSDVDILDADDIALFLKIHSLSLSFIRNHALKPAKANDSKYDFVTPFVNMFEVGCYAFQNKYLNYFKDDEANILMASNLIVKRFDSTLSSTESDDPLYDVYRDSNVGEVVRLGPVLFGMRKRVDELLVDWPDHPALLRIIEVINRIETFDVRSPLVKFLTGLELLLSTAQDWETVAHRGVSIAVQLMELSNLVISWRKLELRFWKNLLEISAAREQKGAKQWWFHLFASAIQFCDESTEEATDKKTFLKVLQQFMEMSPLGQFTARLMLLEELHRHFTGLLQISPSMKTELMEMSSYIWNSLAYYKQFVAAVNARLKSLTAPLEKMIKDFIKISRWNDANFYALRDSVKKGQKTLNKLVSEHQKVLRMPVATVLVADVGVDRPFSEKKNKVRKTNKMSYIMPEEWETDCLIHTSLELNDFSQQLSKRLSKLQRFYQKSRGITRDAVDKDDMYISEIVELDQFSGTVIDKVHELQTLQVPDEQGDRRKKALHHVHNLRRKNLAELFKALQDLGLSFRRGIIHLKNLDKEVEFYDFKIQPTDLIAGWKNLQSGDQCFPADMEVIEEWNGCDEYFQKCLSRISMMLTSFHAPSKELGPSIIDRCKGYAIDLLQCVTEEREAIAKHGKLLWELRTLMTKQKNKSGELVSDHFAEVLYTGCCDLEIEYTQYILLAESLEDQHSDEIKSSLKTVSQTVINEATKIKSKIHDVVNKTGIVELSDGLVDKAVLAKCTSTFVDILGLLRDCKEKFVKSSLLWNSVNDSETRWSNWLQKFNSKLNCPNTQPSIKSQSFSNAMGKTLENILLSLQRLEGFKDEENLKSNSFVNLMPLKRLSSLDLESIVSNVLKIRHSLNHSYNGDYVQRSSLFGSITPLILQFSFTVQFYLKLLAQHHRTSCKLLSILSSVFSTLGQKGFCLPSDYENDAVEEGPEMDEKSGMGLGEGETTSDAKDVSDRLKSEDQLDDTMKAGESAESADKDVGEDNKGVEMSEDFGGKQQEKQDKEADEENENSDDENQAEDLDQEMGDVDTSGEKIDDKLWGGSSDEEEEDPEEQKKEQGKGSAEKGETELASNKDEEQEDNSENANESDPSGESKNKEYNEKSDDEDVNDDQADLYHGENKPEEEPEAMELPDDLQLDDANEKEEKDESGENPFDLDSTERELPQGLDEEEEEKDNTAQEEAEQQLEDVSDDEGNADDAVNVDLPEPGESENPVTEEKEDLSMEVDPEKEEESTLEETKETDADPTEENDTEKKTEASDKPSQKKDDATSGGTDTTRDEEMVAAPSQEEENPSKSDEQAAGQAQSKDGHGHEGKSVNKENMQSSQKEDDTEASRRPGETDSKRSLADNVNNAEDQLKRLKTVDKSQSGLDDQVNQAEDNNEKDSEQTAAELYQHIESAEKKDALTVDNASKEQLDQQKGMQIDNEKPAEENPKMDDTVEEMEVDEDIEEIDQAETDKNAPDLIRGLPENKKHSKNRDKNKEETEVEDSQVEGDIVMTLGAQRPADSYSHTNLELLKEKLQPELSAPMQIETQVETVVLDDNGDATLVEWHDLEAKTLTLSQELCEQLRLVLEPTQAARLKGDYKTGKRLNMRKVIPYIASGFRKDKIWLRRTQASKREYQILLALDDSASMVDNQSKQMAFSAVAVVSRALSLLEAGKLAVGSFGEDFKLIHPFDEPFTDMSGAKVISQFTFAQKRTRIAQLMKDSTTLFTHSKASSSTSLHPDVAQLMIIISDGRGINNEGVELTKKSIMKAREQNVFIVFIIVDNPENQNSILDIRQPVFGPNNAVEIVRYMDNFPFPFYLILRDITSLPSVLSDALRQWFELVTSSDR